jgi:hypothetical protein
VQPGRYRSKPSGPAATTSSMESRDWPSGQLCHVHTDARVLVDPRTGEVVVLTEAQSSSSAPASVAPALGTEAHPGPHTGMTVAWLWLAVAGPCVCAGLVLALFAPMWLPVVLVAAGLATMVVCARAAASVQDLANPRSRSAKANYAALTAGPSLTVDGSCPPPSLCSRGSDPALGAARPALPVAAERAAGR